MGKILSRLETYQINDLERISGIKAHTIRIWEKRYNLFTPHRTDTNIRYYDDEQALKLLNVASLLEHGYKISEVAALTADELKSALEAAAESGNRDAIVASLINDLVASTLVFDEIFFERIFASAVTRLGMYNAILKVIYPFLYKVGIMWSLNDLASIQEHFATNIIRRKLLAAIDGLVLPGKKGKNFLLLLPPDEWHDIPLLFSDYIIRAAGYSTVYLGQNAPIKKLALVLEQTQPNHILIFYVSRREKERIESETELLRRSSSAKLLIGGSRELLTDIKFPTNTGILNSPQDLLAHL